jgi:hypothetical protein
MSYNTLIKVVDDDGGKTLRGVFVKLDGVGSGNTNSDGQIEFESGSGKYETWITVSNPYGGKINKKVTVGSSITIRCGK